VLSESGGLASECGYSRSEFDLGSSGTRDKSAISKKYADSVDSVIKRSLEVVKVVGSSAP
jgi:hypothetical protein